MPGNFFKTGLGHILPCTFKLIIQQTSSNLNLFNFNRSKHFNPLSEESLNPQYVRPCAANFTIIKMFYN
jgi:hypothetical protein